MSLGREGGREGGRVTVVAGQAGERVTREMEEENIAAHGLGFHGNDGRLFREDSVLDWQEDAVGEDLIE